MVPGFFWGEFFVKNVSFEGFIIGVELARPIPKSTSAEDQNQGPEREQLQMCRHKKKRRFGGKQNDQAVLATWLRLETTIFCSRKKASFFFSSVWSIWVLLKILWKVLKEPFLGG